jgi:hypothetical protein
MKIKTNVRAGSGGASGVGGNSVVDTSTSSSNKNPTGGRCKGY